MHRRLGSRVRRLSLPCFYLLEISNQVPNFGVRAQEFEVGVSGQGLRGERFALVSPPLPPKVETIPARVEGV